MNRFTLTEDHVKLLTAAEVGWQDCEYGAPEIDPKRPYGNSSVELDIAEALGWEWDKRDDLPTELRERAWKIHKGTEEALQIILSTHSFEPGVYERERGYGPWTRADA